jgi:integrase
MVIEERQSLHRISDVKAFKEYLERRVRPGTVRAYIDALARWQEYLGSMAPSRELAQRYIDMLANKLAPSTVSLRAHAIAKYFRFHGIHLDLDCPSIAYPEPKYKSMKEIDLILMHCENPREKAVVIVLFDTAIRISELLNLKLDNIHWEIGTITVERKGGRKEDVNISDKAMAALREWLEVRDMNSDSIFGDMAYIDAWRMIKKIGKRSNMDLAPHMLRHSRAIQMLMNNSSLHDVQNHLGHVNIATTANIYGRFKALDLKERIPSW